MDKQTLKNRVYEAIDARFQDIESFGENIFLEPELGYKETLTQEKVKNAFNQLGLKCDCGAALTSVKSRLKGRKSLKTVALLAELDAIVCREHPHSHPQTGAAHCCGHNVQLANLLGVAMAFKDVNVMQYLDGDIVFFAVPAEEYVEIDFRNELKKNGKIRYLGGKAQLIAEGAFEDIDLSMQMHVATTQDKHGDFAVGGSCNGFIGKLIEYKGKASHAAGAPDQGINALNAAMMGVMGVNAIRETFKEADCVRFHPIISVGGDLVNVIPDRVKMESYVRASNIDALSHYNSSINRALRAGAEAIGATCEIKDLPGYLPLRPDNRFRSILRLNACEIFGEKHVFEGEHSAGSTDMGDVSHLMPVVHPWVGCARGVLHGADYVLADHQTAYKKTVKVLAGCLIDLLWNEAQEAQQICEHFHPIFTRQTYCEFMDNI